MAKRFEVGTILSIKNLRLRKSYSEKIYQGLLGGNQRLIEKLVDGNSVHVEMKTRLLEYAFHLLFFLLTLILVWTRRKVDIKNRPGVDSDTKPASEPVSAEVKLEVEPGGENAAVKETGQLIIKSEATSPTGYAAYLSYAKWTIIDIIYQGKQKSLLEVFVGSAGILKAIKELRFRRCKLVPSAPTNSAWRPKRSAISPNCSKIVSLQDARGVT